MDIQICQCCGVIIRGKSKFCTGCGTTISKFSQVTLPVIAHTQAPLAVTLDPDPLVLERTLIKVKYANLPIGATVYGGDGGNGLGNGGNGHGNGSAGNGSSQTAYAEPDMVGAGQAAASSTSKLQNILGNAAVKSLPGRNPGALSEMISLDNDAAPAGAPGAAYDNGAEEAGALPEELAPVEFAPPVAPAQANFSPAPQAQPQYSATRPGDATFARIVSSAGAFDALAGSTSSTIPVSVTTAISPGLDSGAVMAGNLSSAPTMVPITAAEAPVGTPAATSIPNITTVVAPQTGSPENIASPPPAAQTPPPPPTQQTPLQPAASQGVPDLQTQPTEILPPSEAPPTVAQPAATTPPPVAPEPPPVQSAPVTPAPVAPALAAVASGAPDFFDSAPAAPVGTPAVNSDAPPPMMSSEAPPAVAATTPAPMTEQIVIAPPTIPSTPPASTPFNPIAGGGGSFDFFAQTASPIPPAAQPSASPPGLGSVVAPEPVAVLDANKFGNGVPSVVADAIRAAASASQTNLTPVNAADAEDKTRIIADGDEFPDGSVNRGKKKENDDDSQGRRSDSARSRRDYNESAEKAKEPEKTLKLGGIELKMKSALTALILICFLGIPATFFVFNAIGGAISKIAGGASGGGVYLGGDWEFGVLSNNRNVKGTVNIQQVGNTFTGMGIDNFGNQQRSFRIVSGVFQPNTQPPKLQFQKIYVDRQGRPDGKPITFAGAVDWVNPEPGQGKIPFFSHMYGVWQFQKREGYGWRGQIVMKTGKWEAGQIRVDSNRKDGGISGIAVTPGWDPFGWVKDALAFPSDGSPAKMAQFFARLAGVLLLLGLGLVAASVKFFGPAGLLNIWSKKEYIPSQFKSQHYKMVKEFGGGLKPGGLPLGWRADWNLLQFWWPRKLALPPDVRTVNPHLLMLGAGAKGKSRLMASMIYHDIESNDRAVVVIDSDGGMIDLLMSKIASSPKGQEIARRLIIIDPTHGGDIFAYNPLEYPDDGDLQNAASAVVFGFKAIYTEPPGSQSQWNQQTANILRNSAILLMANGKTLTDLPVLLSENDFRDVLLEKVERLKGEKAEYTTLLEAWNQYKRLARTDQWINWVEPILNRVQPMLGDPRIRPILTKPKGDLNLKEVISEGKILFVKVPQGQLDQNANLLGSLIVTGLKQAAMSLSLKGTSRRHPCALYLDEFDNFIEKETYDAITSETKKFQIGFVGASKTLQGLPEDYRNQLIINCGTMAIFALAKKDGDMLGPQMFRVDGRKIKHQTLQNIFNKVNTAPQFELISDEEKLNIDRVVGQEERHYFCYRVGTVAGVFQMKAPDFEDVPDKDINWTLIDQIYARSIPKE